MPNTPARPDQPVLIDGLLHCPACGAAVDIWEETRQVDRITYDSPRWDADQDQWTYLSDGHSTNESVELLERYAQCTMRRCGLVFTVEERDDEATELDADHDTCGHCGHPFRLWGDGEVIDDTALCPSCADKLAQATAAAAVGGR